MPINEIHADGAGWSWNAAARLGFGPRDSFAAGR